MRRRVGSGANPSRIATVFLLIVIVAAVIWLASAGSAGEFLSEKIIAPLFKSNNTPDPSQTPMGETTPKPSQEVSGEKISQTLQYPPFSVYAVQLGAFSLQENAAYQSQAVKTRGAAGYIMEDQGLYRILATVFYDETDARSVKDNLLDQDIDACLKPLVIEGLTLNITATADQVAAIKNAHDQWLSSALILSQLDRGFDSKVMTRQQVSTSISDIILTLKTTREQALATASGSPVVDAVCQELQKSETELQKLTDPVLSDAMLSSQIKYCLIDTLWRFGKYASTISKQ